MTKIYKHQLFILLLSIGTSYVWAQTTPQPNYTLQSNLSGANKTYLAWDFISLKQGFKFTASPTTSMNAKIQEGIPTTPTSNTYAKPDGTITTNPSEGGIVGSIPGQFNVGASGGATYNIPIECPAGINGMQPDISLVYNSQGGDGPLGVGWGIGGLSSITKTTKTIFSDNAISGVDKYNDTYTLDGNKLFVENLVSPDIPHWVTTINTVLLPEMYSDYFEVLLANSVTDVGSTYKTENKSYSKIETIGFIPNISIEYPTSTTTSWKIYSTSPRYFKITSKDGRIIEYAASKDSVLITSDADVSYEWLVKKITDTNGNFMNFTYQSNNGQTVIKKIDYTGNGNQLPFCSVMFNYSIKTTEKTNIYGNIQKEDKFLLNNIQILSNATTLKQYDISYAVRNEKNYLEQIKLTGLSNQKFNSTVFVWGTDGNSIGVSNLPTPEPYSQQAVSKSDRYWLSADVNGDGRDEVINIYPAKIADQNGVLQTKDYIQVFKPSVAIATGQITLTNDAYYDIGTGLSYADIKSVNPSVLIGDINGDGKKELIIPKLDLTNGAKVKFMIAGGTTYERPLLHSSVLPACTLADINNDGIDEIIFLEKGKDITPSEYVYGEVCYTKTDNSKIWNVISAHLGLGSTALPISIIPNDFDNDGLTDLIVTHSGGYAQSQNTGNASLTLDYKPVGFYAVDGMSGNYLTMKTGDFDGNGTIEYQDFASAMTHKSNSQVLSVTNEDFIITDFNHDGKSDYIIVNREYGANNAFIQTTVTWNASIINGTTIVKTFISTDPNYSFRKFNCTGDFDGDGREDVLSYGSDMYNGPTKSDNVFVQRSYNIDLDANQIKEITNGMGKKTLIGYQPLTYTTTTDNKPFYTKGNSSTYPIADIQMPLFCVNKVSEPNGLGGQNVTEFAFTEARAQLTGRGFMGFKTQTISNATINRKIVSTTEMNLNLCMDSIATTEVSTVNGTPLSKTVSTFTNSRSTDKILLSLPLKTIENDSLSDLTKTTEYVNFDSYGNLTAMKTSQGTLISTQTLTYIQKGGWCPNMVATQSTTNKQGTDSITRNMSYTYDDKGNLTKVITDPGDINQLTVEYKDWNNFGQPTKTETTANGKVRTATITTSGRFVNTKTDQLGQSTTYNWDTTRGLLNSETNRIGTTTYTYNGLGQLNRSDYPDGTYTLNVAQWASPDNAYGARFYLYQAAAGSAPVYTWFDGMQRTILKEAYGLNGKKSRVFTQYRTDGKTEKISAPTFGSQATAWDAVYDYYAEGRLKSVTTPLGTTSNVYNKKITTVTTPETTQITTINSIGQVISSKVNGKTVAYTYFASGKMKTATPDGSPADSMEYDLQANRIKLTDPDVGVSTAKYNGYGELNWEKQTNNATQGLITTNYTYNDASGMIDNINRNGQVTQYGYDTDKRLSTVEIAGQHKQSYTYGSYDRVTKLTEITGGTKTLEKQMSYDDFGRVARQTFPSGYYTENHYDDYGNLTEVTDMYDRLIYKATEANARGQLTKILKGATETVYGYNDTKGQLTSMVAANVVNYSYGYDAKNNLEYRGDNLIGQKEKFTYDTQNRLTNWDILNSATNAVLKQNSITYNATTGNITGKSDLNVPSAVTFNYEKTTNPHALTTISPKSDAISSDELAVTYTDFRKIKTLNENGKSYTITYGVDNQRRKSEYTASGSTTTRYYFGDYEEVIVGSNVRKIHYLSGAIYIQNNSSDSLLYTYADNQGSLIALTEEDGTIINKFAYDPWGKRRSATNWTLSATPPSVGWGAFNRGYTGHEHLDMFNIINMNGRVYDPLTAMFFSPDPFIQSRGEWKNYNRYSYCMNNPTRYTDPSGYKYCYIDMPAFDDNASNWMRAASGGGGKNSALKLWDAPHRGSISYNWENGKYYYANGDEASFQDALDKWRTSSDAKTYYGRDASTAYKSIRYGSEATNKSLANIRNIAKTMIADIQKTKNTLFMMVVSSNALTSLSKISTLLISEPALEMIGGYASIYILVLGFEGDTNHKGYTNNFYEERGNPFKEQNRYENEMKNQDQQPPKGLWWLIIGSGVWSLYDSWPKPEVSIPTKTVQPIFQPLPITPYNQYFMNLK